MGFHTWAAIRSHTNLLRVTDWSGKRSRHGYGRLGLVGAYMRSASVGLRPKAYVYRYLLPLECSRASIIEGTKVAEDRLNGETNGSRMYFISLSSSELRRFITCNGPPPPAEPRHVALKITSLAAARTDPRSLIQTTITRAASR